MFILGKFDMLILEKHFCWISLFWLYFCLLGLIEILFCMRLWFFFWVLILLSSMNLMIKSWMWREKWRRGRTKMV